ncbi:MAG TPA: hypothetical protein PLX89_27160 [Verrucomicrobiota bacterium]|nr:hypothetical protein [Verrucomicrobiota bacterium]
MRPEELADLQAALDGYARSCELSAKYAESIMARTRTQMVVEWLRRHEPELGVNPIILGELEYAILLLPAGRRGARLGQWFQAGVHRLRVLDFAGRVRLRPVATAQ